MQARTLVSIPPLDSSLTEPCLRKNRVALWDNAASKQRACEPRYMHFPCSCYELPCHPSPCYELRVLSFQAR